MTVGDSIALVAGVALALAMIRLPRHGIHVAVFAPGIRVIQGVIAIFVAATEVLAVVALGRTISYRRMPRNAEWLAILIAATMIVSTPFFQGLAIRLSILPGFTVGYQNELPTLEGWIYFLGLAGSVAMIAPLAILLMGRFKFAPWLKTICLIALAMLAELGPFRFLREIGPNLIAPANGFGAGDLAVLHRGICILIAEIPIGLFYAVPAIAVFSERIGGLRWVWTEWASLSTSAMVGVSLSLLYRGEFHGLSLGWLAERVLIVAWFLIVALLSRQIVIRLGPAWWRWIGESMHQNVSVSAPASSTL